MTLPLDAARGDLVLELLWTVLTAAGRPLALSFIVALALGIGALTLFFFGSSVVVLERFARTTRRSSVAVVLGLVWALSLVAVFLDRSRLAGLGIEASEQGRAFALLALGIAAAVGIAMGVCALGVRVLSASRLGALSLAVLGLSYGVLVGSAQQVVIALAPLVAVAATAALLGARDRGRAAPGAAGPGRLLWLLAGALAPGPILALVLSEPSRGLAVAGAWGLSGFLGLVLLGLLPLAAAGLVDARGSAEWFIAVRYLFAKRRQTFISTITLICVGGVAAGVWLIITVISVMNGFERTWREEIIGNRAHLTVLSGLGPFPDYRDVMEAVLATPGVVAASPYVDADGMVQGGTGVRVRGIDPARVGDVTDLRADLVEGSLDALLPHEDGSVNGKPGILIGSQLASAYGFHVGDAMRVISPIGGPQTPLGPAPRLFEFRVAGIFSSRFYQFDEVYTYVSLETAQAFQRSGDVVDGIEVRVTDFYRSQRVGSELAARLGFPYFARDWKEYVPAFFQALKTERVMMFVLLTMIMVVAAFVIVATLIMMIMEKSSDIAILKAMGASDATVERVFAIEGTLIGLAGIALGVLAGVAVTTQLAWIQRQIEAVTGIDTLPASVYQLSSLPWEIDATQVAGIAGIALVLSLGATLLPSRRGARLDPAEALRYE